MFLCFYLLDFYIFTCDSFDDVFHKRLRIFAGNLERVVIEKVLLFKIDSCFFS